MLRKQRREPCGAACAGVATDRGIDHRVLEALLFEAFFQQGDPSLAAIQAKSGADTIADHKQGACNRSLSPEHQGQGTTEPPCTHLESP